VILRQVGDVAVLADELSPGQVDRLRAALAGGPPLADVVPGAGSLLVRLRPGGDLGAAAQTIRDALATIDAESAAGGVPADREPEVVLGVHYDGADLTEVARLTGLSARGVVAAHTGTPWRVAFMGFAPGFGYLTDGDPRLAVPRRDHPRPAVPPGAVGLAGGYSGVYPRESPGGWQLIGRTADPLWDLATSPPAVLRPGVRVRFEERR
jgi:KipI family sensor histidine kinase inhibitor